MAFPSNNNKPEDNPIDVNESQPRDDISVEQTVLENHAPEAEHNTAADQPQVHASSSRHRALIIAGVLVLLVAAGVGVWQYMSLKHTPVQSSQNVANQPKAIDETPADPEMIRFIKPTTGEVWYDTPKPMEKQGWLVSELPSSYVPVAAGANYPALTVEEQMADAAPTYKEVGKRGDSTIVLAYSKPDMGQYVILFERHADGKVEAILKPQSTVDYGSDGVKADKEAVNTAKVTLNETTKYDSLSVPHKVPLGNNENGTPPPYFRLTTSVYNPEEKVEGRTLVKTLGSNKLYRIEKQFTDTKLTNIGYEIKTPIGTTVGLEYTPNTLSLEKYTFDDKSVMMQTDTSTKKVKPDTLVAIARGCGGTRAAVTRGDALATSDLVAVGKTDAGRTVYEISDKNAALWKKAYDEYVAFYKPSGAKIVTEDTFRANHALMIIENARGEKLVYVRESYAVMGGCAKPVIYLYPTAAQTVNVKVGADVKISDPLYVGGWTVWARPEGVLSMGARSYSSLFWEGTGIGEYPAITSGTVVEYSNAAGTMRSQLAQQGLNAQETSDFMAYWEPKIPNKPYVRLTWFNTAYMEALAPLRVTPKPDTVLRVFLDMDGFDAPVPLPQQVLTATPRTGFTVVEWGGLTTEGIK